MVSHRHGWAIFLGIESFASTAHSHWQGPADWIRLFSSAIYAYHAHTHQMPCFVADYLNNIYAIGILGNFFARLGGNAFLLLPLMLQVAFHFEPFITGLMMIPGLRFIGFQADCTTCDSKFGYRTVLVVNTILVGLPSPVLP